MNVPCLQAFIIEIKNIIRLSLTSGFQVTLRFYFRSNFSLFNKNV